MKILLLLLCAASLFLSTSYQAQESPELNEAEELAASVIKLFNQQKFDEALPLAKKALQIREKLLPRTDYRVTASLNHLGDLYLAKRDYNAAKQVFEKLLPILEERSGPTDKSLGATLDRLAVLYHRQGNMSKAETMYQRAVAVREKAFGPDNVMVAEPLFALAQFYRLRKDPDQALPNYQRVMSIYEKVSGTNTAEFERATNGLSCIAYESQGDEYFKKVDAIRRQFKLKVPARELLPLMNGMAKYLEKPEYPQEARDLRLSGTVVLLVDIDETGTVTAARDMCQGLPYLTQSCIRAALKSRFLPTRMLEAPIKVKGVLRYNFVNTGTTYR